MQDAPNVSAEPKAPSAAAATALLAIHCCSEFSAFGSGEMAVRLLPEPTGVDGWTEITGEQLDELLDCGLLRLAGEDEVWVTNEGLQLLCDRDWFDRAAKKPTEQGRYWLGRLVRRDDRRHFKNLLSSYRATVIASAVLGPIRIPGTRRA